MISISYTVWSSVEMDTQPCRGEAGGIKGVETAAEGEGE